MRYLEFDNAYGRLSNHFYWLLQAHKVSKQFNEPVKMLKNASYYDFKLEQSYNLFNMSQFAVDKTVLRPGDAIFRNVDDQVRRYHQLFRIDFSLEEVESFVIDTFLKSDAYKSHIALDNQDNIIAIHIRNGDYVNNWGMDIFDRKKYIEDSIAFVDQKIDTIYVFSDDNKLNEALYKDILTKRFKNVIFVNGNSGVEDFIQFSLFKNKILWNSTFSYWAAFIGNVIYPHSYRNVIAPSRFGKTDPIADRINPMWTVVEV